MSRIKVTVAVCDSCGQRSDDPARFTGFKIVGSGFAGEYDLCPGCVTDFSKSLGMGGELPRPKTRARRGPTVETERARKEWSSSEIEYIKDNLNMPNEEIAEEIGRSAKAVALRKRRIILETQKVGSV